MPNITMPQGNTHYIVTHITKKDEPFVIYQRFDNKADAFAFHKQACQQYPDLRLHVYLAIGFFTPNATGGYDD